MSDKKLSSLTAATSVSSTDWLYLVKSVGNAMFKLPVGVLLKDMANACFGSNVSLTGQETVSAPGAIDPMLPVTKLVGDGSGGNVTLAAGTSGRLKTIAMVSTVGGTYTLSLANANTSVSFSRVGHSASLIYLSNAWIVTGGTANVTVS